MPQKKNSTKVLLYYCAAIIITIGMVLISLIFSKNIIATEIFTTLYKIMIIVVISIVLIKKCMFKEMFKGKYLDKILLLSLLYISYNTLISITRLNFKVNYLFLLLSLLGVITTVIWEEIYFRHLGKILFTNNNQITKKNLIIVSLGFALPHIANIINPNYNIINILFLLLLSFSMSLVLIPIYIKKENILIPITIHFSLNISSQFFNHFSNGTPYLNDYSIIFLIVLIILNILIGIILSKKYNIIKNC